ncbi:isoamylase isoform 2 [Dorcoceras hygrometricum]|nr:isoamylase isoform 2 [Dorcoceras hygrometricum]
MLPVHYACPSCGASESSYLFAAKFGKYVEWVTRDLVKFDLKQKKDRVRLNKFGGRISLEHHVMKALATSDVSVVQTTGKLASYRFRTEIGGQLKVLVRKNSKFEVHVEASNLPGEEDEGLIMRWGLFRSDSSIFMPLNFQQSTADSKDNVVETPFLKDSVGRLAVELDFDASLTPFYVSFLLKSSNSKIPTIRSHRTTNFVVPVGFGSGRPFPLGLSFLDDRSINFAFFSSNAEGVVLCLYSDGTADKPALEIDLDPYVNRSGYIWHALIQDSLPFVSYGYRCRGGIANRGQHVLLDPYATVIKSFGLGLNRKWLGKLCEEPAFDWSGESRPSLPLEKLIVYRLNVTRFTKDKSSKLPTSAAGTFYGIYEKLHHFKDLGVNAILLEPIFPSDERKEPYFPWHFFSPGSSYGPSDDLSYIVKSMKEMVKKLHASGIEVLLEVVFTHTGEDVTLKGIDESYYHSIEDLKSKNMLNCNYPVVQQLILESLRHWVIEYHIDGFCFINASSLLRGKHGEFLSRPPLVEAIAFDPLLSQIKIIADSWDPHGMESKELVFPHWKRWAEMNGKFCADARNFLRGQGSISSLTTRFCGSGDIFAGGRGPAFSFNYITRNVGLTLIDLVSFGSEEIASQLSWNCGEEGPTNKISVLERRLKQIRNFLFLLFLSLGVPVLNMGDEFGQSCAGSLAYTDRTPLDWNSLRSGFSIQITQFISFLCSLKMRRGDFFQRKSFLEEDKIEWHGTDLSPPKWDDPSTKFVAVTLKVGNKLSQSTSAFPEPSGDLFVAFNSDDQSEEVALPPLPDNTAWVRLVDTALTFPGFFSVDGVPLEDGLTTYEMQSHSCVLFEARNL